MSAIEQILGTEIAVEDQPRSTTRPISTGTLFLADFAERGAVGEVLGPFYAIDEAEDEIGDRVAFSGAHDYLDVYFRERGAVAYFSRVAGGAAAKATLNLSSSVPTALLRVDAATVGAYGNGATGGYKAQGLAPDTAGFRIAIQLLDGSLVTSPDLADPPAAAAWATGNPLLAGEVTVTSLVSTGVVAPSALTSLAGGTDDHASADDDDWQSALDVFGPELGPGQVAFAGRTTDVAHGQLGAHATAYNRFALWDLADTADSATLLASQAAIRALGDDAAHGSSCGAWLVAPDPVGAGATRRVPGSALRAGLLAASDATNGPNEAASGLERGVSRYCIDVGASWDLATQKALRDAGVNIPILYNGVPVWWGARTGADPVARELVIWEPNVRLDMDVVARAQPILDAFEFTKLDGRRVALGKLEGQLTGLMLSYGDQLYDKGPEDPAFRVDATSQTINPDAQLAARFVKASVAFRRSPGAERISLTLIRRPITEAV